MFTWRKSVMLVLNVRFEIFKDVFVLLFFSFPLNKYGHYINQSCLEILKNPSFCVILHLKRSKPYEANRRTRASHFRVPQSWNRSRAHPHGMVGNCTPKVRPYQKKEKIIKHKVMVSGWQFFGMWVDLYVSYLHLCQFSFVRPSLIFRGIFTGSPDYHLKAQIML